MAQVRSASRPLRSARRDAPGRRERPTAPVRFSVLRVVIAFVVNGYRTLSAGLGWVRRVSVQGLIAFSFLSVTFPASGQAVKDWLHSAVASATVHSVVNQVSSMALPAWAERALVFVTGMRAVGAGVAPGLADGAKANQKARGKSTSKSEQYARPKRSPNPFT